VESRQQLITLDGEAIVLETNRDIRDRKEWEERQRLMNRELAHRVKNSFAVLQAILRSTLKSAPDPTHFAQAFSGRLHSLSAAHDVLSANDWRGAELGSLLRHQLAVYLSGQRITLTGRPVNLLAEHTAPISLIANELATNAVKYGALSVPQGVIAIAWRVEARAEGDQILTLEWREQGGPPADAPGPRSFGTTLIEKSLAGAKVDIAYERSGLVCIIAWPLPKPAKRR
jgi:two-component system, chemotaxis family, CheB/CheR fusion protein